MKLFNVSKYIIFLSVLLIIDCSLGGYIGFWREKFWNSVSTRDFYLFSIYIAQFSFIALCSCFTAGYIGYLQNIIGLYWRTKLTNKALALQNHITIEGGAQRVQEDCLNYPLLCISLIVGLFKALIMICVFAYILLHQLGWVYLIIPIIYTLMGTLLAGKIAFPLIKLNYLNQVVEAKFRQFLTIKNYVDVHGNNRSLFKTTKFLSYFQSFYNQITVIIPYVILSFLYFKNKITFGVFMQSSSSMIEIISNMSYTINSFNDINRFISCRKRLKELKII